MLNERIRLLRKTLRLSKERFASKLGMSSSSVYDWEYGKVEIKESSLLLIEFVYQINPSWLRNGDGEMFMPTLIPELQNFFDSFICLPKAKQVWIVEELKRHAPHLVELVINK